MGEAGTTSRGGSSGGDRMADWLGDYAERVTDYWQRTAQASASLGRRWGDRSIEQEQWTVDTTTADAVEAWEELTPLVGEGIELGLEAVRRLLVMGRTDA